MPKKLFVRVGKDIEDGNSKDGINKIFDFISFANKYFDEKQPWILAKENVEKGNEVLFNCVNIIYNVNTLLKPFLPFTSETVENYLECHNNNWIYRTIDKLSIKSDIKPLYERYDKHIIDEEISLLKND